MIAAWMASALLFALLLALAATVLERALRALGLAGRLPWIAALAAAVVWPLLAPLASRLSPPPEAPAVTLSAVRIVAGELPGFWSQWSAYVTPALLSAWAVVSLTLLARLAIAVRAAARLAREARAEQVEGASVLVSESLGPAVFGVRKPRVVVPRWLLALDRPLRALVIAHEREHCAAGDTRLVLGAALATACVPWNAGVWWIARRLRLALELDCDARVLQGAANPERYGRLLLLIAQRQAHTPLAPMLAESNSHLSRRIAAMTASRPTKPVLVAACLVAVAGGILAVACSPRIGSDLTGPKPTAGNALTGLTGANAVYFEFQVEKPVTPSAGNVAPGFPAALKQAGVEGEVLVQFVVDENGAVMPGTTKVLKASHELFKSAVVGAVASFKFSPALVGNRPVKQVVQEPFVFAIAGSRGVVVPAAMATRHERQAIEVASARPSAATTAPGGSYFEFQVEQQATPKAGNPSPRYPDALKPARAEGEVLIQFVVDQDGTVLAGSHKVLNATNEAFARAVVAALPNMRFNPATVGGRAVRQLVQMPFEFAAERQPGSTSAAGAEARSTPAANDNKQGVRKLEPVRVTIP